MQEGARWVEKKHAAERTDTYKSKEEWQREEEEEETAASDLL